MCDKKLIVIATDSILSLPIELDVNNVFVYLIGTGSIKGLNPNQLVSDCVRLNQIAEEQRFIYSDWVYQQNQHWLDQGLVYENKLSLFFLTDFSCKRSELFSTYNDICNIINLREIVEEKGVDAIHCVGIDQTFLQSIKSAFDEVSVTFEKTTTAQSKSLRYLLGTVRYFVNALIISIFNFVVQAQKQVESKSQPINRFFLTRYPLHFLEGIDKEEKYGDMVEENDRFLTSMITDGMHQRVSLASYFHYRSVLKNYSKHYLLDDYLSPYDIVKTILSIPITYIRWRKLQGRVYEFDGIDISHQVRKELQLSFHRVIRLLIWFQPITRFFSKNSCKELVYYLHEYPYGRMFSYLLAGMPSITTVGFQHGPASVRQLFYFLSKNELIHFDDYLNAPALPGSVLAENESSQLIYLSVGYRNVTIMPEIYRLSYLKNINVSSKKKYVLIATGLHDGELLLDYMSEEIESNSEKKYYFKPHPRSSLSYLERNFKPNFQIVKQHISELLGEAERVIVTYSSVGYEAHILGIPVDVINIPGKVNRSPLD